MDARDARDARDEPLAINLKVLSPSSEIEGGLHLRDLAASTTVRELRLRIQDAVPSRPGPERMRLIYRGKVVANDADSLEAVFGADNIRESRDQSLHLVLRELPQSASASTPAPPNPFRPAQPLPASPPLHTNPFRTIPQPRPHSQPQAPHPHPLHPHHTHAHHAHYGQPPLAPLGMPIPPHIQQQLAHALGQTPQQPAAGAAPAEGAPAPQPPVLPPGLAAMPAPPGRTVRQEGIGPNGARWSVTYNDFTANIPLRPGQPTMPRPVPHHAAFAVPPRPFGSPAPGGVNVPLSWLLPRLRGTLQEAAREVDNVRTLLELPTTPEAPGAPSSAGPAFPTWRVDRIREHLRTIAHSLNTVENGLSDPAMQLNMDVIALRQAAGEVRRQANEFSRTIQERAQSTSPSDPLIATAAAAGTAPSDSTSAAAGTAPSDSTSAAARTLPSDAPPELFLLSSPQGPVGVLFDQRGTYTTAPFTSTSTSQNFVDHFNQNRQLIAGLGQHIAQGAQNLRNQLGNVQPTPAQPAQPDNPLDHAAAQRVIDRIVQGPNQDQAAPAAPEAPNERVINVAGHLWLIFKLACFVYIFAGGGGWYRPLMLGSIALVVYVVQLGIFEAQFAHMRHHFEALLPNAERLAQGRAQPPDTAHAAHPARLTPEEAARRLLLQRRNGQWGWARDAMRTLERGVALFVASLWPGIGERMVHAQEERERLARVAVTEERERREEEARRAGEADKAEQGEKGEKGEQGEETEKSEHSEHSEKSEQVEKSSEHTNNPHETDPTTTHPPSSESNPHPTPPAPLHRTHTDSLPVHFMDAPLERTKGDDVEVEQAGQRVKGKESVKGKERAVLLGEGEGAGEAEAGPRSEARSEE